MLSDSVSVVAISGGVGGAKLALGLDRCLPSGQLAVLVNTGDDFRHLGLHICPDLDTVMYTLAGVVHPGQGWGRDQESFGVLDELRRLGGPSWFMLGDRDIALHLERTARLAAGERLTAITADLAARFGLRSCLLPMSDDPVSTLLETVDGPLEFQHYFVRLRCEPAVRSIRFDGADRARPTPEVLAALSGASLEAVLICPSNPYLSIDPVLAVPGLREALQACPAPVVAVSPLIGGRAVKGPTAKIMRELGVVADTRSIIRHYAGLIDGIVVDAGDPPVEAPAGLGIFTAHTLMRTLEDRERLAREVLEFAGSLSRVCRAGRRRP